MLDMAHVGWCFQHLHLPGSKRIIIHLYPRMPSKTNCSEAFCGLTCFQFIAVFVFGPSSRPNGSAVTDFYAASFPPKVQLACLQVWLRRREAAMFSGTCAHAVHFHLHKEETVSSGRRSHYYGVRVCIWVCFTRNPFSNLTSKFGRKNFVISLLSMKQAIEERKHWHQLALDCMLSFKKFGDLGECTKTLGISAGQHMWNAPP